MRSPPAADLLVSSFAGPGAGLAPAPGPRGSTLIVGER
jgi:hypothetical protein